MSIVPDAAMAKSPMRGRVDVHDPVYRDRVSAVLKQHYFTHVEEGYLDTDLGRNMLADHVARRYEQVIQSIVPWLEQKYDLSGRSMIEIGSGTGSSTLALAQVAQSVTCFEIHAGAIAVARERLQFWGMENARINEALFDTECEFVRAGGTADAIVFYAVLEHMTLQECLDALRLAWSVLRPGGILLVAETPNRLSVMDEHTSRLPFFTQLPRELQVLYAPRSPRRDFRWAIAAAARESTEAALMMMTRWGVGVSFHEFELAIGDEIHQAITLDGYEPEITNIFPVTDVDTTLVYQFKSVGVSAHRAFTRRMMYFVAEKR